MIILARFPVNTERCPRFSKAEETELFHRMNVGDMEAADLLARSVMGWAICKAKQLGGGRIDHIELQSMAGQAVADSLPRWVPSRGRLSTCVGWGVRSVVSRHLLTSTGPMRVPEENREDNPFNSQAIHCRKRAASLDAPVSGARGRARSRHETLVSHDPGPAEVCEYREELRGMLDVYRAAAEQIPGRREREILFARHGGVTYRDLAKRYGVSHQRIRQLFLKAEEQFHLAIREMV